MNIFHKRSKEQENLIQDEGSLEDMDWRDLEALPKEVLSKHELDNMQKDVISEIRNLQNDATSQAGEDGSAQPQTLFYYHKYIDAKFNKQEFDVDTYYARKQNIVDQKYAEGLGELRSEFTGYKELLDQIHEADQRMRRKIKILDPESNIEASTVGTYDDNTELMELVSALPEEINWDKLEKETL